MTQRLKTLEAGYYKTIELKKIGFKKIGKNVLISKHINIVGPSNISIGNNVRIDSNTNIIAKNGYLKIGDYVHISSANFLACYGGVEIKSFSTTAPDVKIFSLTSDYSGAKFPNPLVEKKISKPNSKKVTIGKFSIIGAGSIIIPGGNLLEGTALGALSILNKTTNKWSIFAGVPAKKIGNRSKQFLKDLKNYNYI